jgi:hypothetical protein
MRLSVGVSAAGAFASRGAAATEAHGDTVVVALEPAAGAPLPRGVAAVVRRTLETRSQRDVLDVPALEERLNQVGQTFRPLTPRAALIRKDADEILDAAAFGRDAEAISRGRLLIDLQRADLASLGVSDDVARAIADTCLFVVRALAHQGDDAGALAQARECARLVPDLTMSRDLHPAEVQELFSKAKASGPTGKLSVAAKASARAACTVRLQGRLMSRLPATLELVPGVYAVQTECLEDRGFVRELVIEPGAEQRLETAPELEAHLKARGAGLEVGGAALSGEDGRAALEQVRAWVHARELWTLEQQSRSLVLSRLEGAPGALSEVGRRIISAAPAESLETRVEAAVMSLSCGAPPCPDVPREAPADREEALPWRTLGVVGVSAGAAAVAVSWFAYARYSSLESGLGGMQYDSPRYADDLDTRDTFRTTALATTTAGSVLLASALPAVLPERRAVPAWAWGIGVGGAAALGVGTALWARNGKLESTACREDETCLRPRSTLPLAPMLVTQGMALLSVPATYLLRRLTSSSRGLAVEASLGAVSLSYGGPL